MTLPDTRRSTIVTARLAALAALIVVALPPFVCFGVGYLLHASAAQATGESIAWWMSERIALHPERMPDLGVAELRQRLPADGASERIILDLNGTVLLAAEAQGPLVWPRLTRAVPLRVGDRVVGSVQVRRSLSGTLGLTGLAALLCAGLGLALWRSLYRQPLRALHRTEAQLHRIAERDLLTGLPNRDVFRERLLHAIEQLRGTTSTVGVLCIDLDRFQLVNQTLGTRAGDALLRAVAERISAAIRHSDTAARLAADEFAVLVEDLSDPDAAAAVAAHMLAAFEQPFVIAGRELIVAPSIGIALFLIHATSIDGVLKCADAAMRAAKHAGGACYRMYESTMIAGTRKHLELENRLRRALPRNEFNLTYQPIMDTTTERVVGMETLLRLKASESDSASPAQFIPLLEQMGLIATVGEWVLREACRQGVQWINAGRLPLIMSVNVSPRQFQDAGFVSMVEKVLEESAFPPAQLQLEVTEGMIMDASADILERIDQIASLGVRVAVDDFGTGYSSLAYLKRFRLHGLKIDRTFVRDMDTERDAAAIVQAVTSLARHLGLTVTAEGVENRSQLRMLREFGCDCVQGYLLGKPLSRSEMTKLIARQAGAQQAERNAVGALPLAADLAA